MGDMSTKKSFHTLCLITIMLIAIYSLYFIPEEYYIGYYPIGVVQFILVIGSVVTLIRHVRHCMITKIISIKDSLIMTSYIILILFMGFSLLVWTAFFPFS